MAELLVFTKNNIHPDTVMNSACCYKAGDIIHVAPDRWRWGSVECIPKFYIVRVDLPLSDAMRFTEPLCHPPRQRLIKDPYTNKDVFYYDEPEIKVARRYCFDFSKLPKAELDRINNALGWHIPTITANQIIDKGTLF